MQMVILCLQQVAKEAQGRKVLVERRRIVEYSGSKRRVQSTKEQNLFENLLWSRKFFNVKQTHEYVWELVQLLDRCVVA